jgi:transposase
MLQPVVRRTWAPRGRTPIIKSWDRHDRLSAISALTIPPIRRRLGLHFTVQGRNVRWPDVYRFLSSLLSRLRRPLTVVLDRLSAHRGAASRLKTRFGDRIEFEWLPAYAPKLDPVEYVWGHTKYSDLANYVPEDIDALREELSTSLQRKRGDADLLRSFFTQAELEL